VLPCETRDEFWSEPFRVSKKRRLSSMPAIVVIGFTQAAVIRTCTFPEPGHGLLRGAQLHQLWPPNAAIEITRTIFQKRLRSIFGY
jgi:hypothetical protein